MHLIRKHLLRGAEGMLNHEIGQLGLLDLRRAGDQVFLRRPQAKLKFAFLE